MPPILEKPKTQTESTKNQKMFEKVTMRIGAIAVLFILGLMFILTPFNMM